MEPLPSWWHSLPNEPYWLEVTDRTDLGANLKAPQTNEKGEPFWSYSLVREVRAVDVVFHYRRGEAAITASSVATGKVWEDLIVWAARGTYARDAGIQPHARPGIYGGLEGFAPLPELEGLRMRKPKLETRIDEVDLSAQRLVVRNSGANAKVTAQIRIKRSVEFSAAVEGRSYRGYWEDSTAAEASILNGHEARLLIGGTSPAGPSSPIAFLSLCFFDPLTGGQDALSEDFLAVSDPPQPKPQVFIEVTLSAEPELRDGPLTRNYLLSQHGLMEWDHPL